MLDAPRGRRTHPMGERIRNALFNSIISEIQDAEVLDAFAGTGALGLEALSRGAKSVIMVEKDRLAQKIISKNIEMLGAEEEATLIRSSMNSWISTNEDKRFDLIFVDPPYYEFERHFATIDRILGLLKPGALMILSRPGRIEESAILNGTVVEGSRTYSECTLTFYRRTM